MKKLLIILTFSFAAVVSLSAQNVQKLFQKYMDDERFEYIFRKGSNIGEDFKDKNVGDEYKYNFLSVMEETSKEMLMLESQNSSFVAHFLKELNDAIDKDNYEMVSKVRQKKNSVGTYFQRDTKKSNKVVIIKDGNKRITIIWKRYRALSKKRRLG